MKYDCSAAFIWRLCIAEAIRPQYCKALLQLCILCWAPDQISGWIADSVMLFARDLIVVRNSKYQFPCKYLSFRIHNCRLNNIIQNDRWGTWNFQCVATHTVSQMRLISDPAWTPKIKKIQMKPQTSWSEIILASSHAYMHHFTNNRSYNLYNGNYCPGSN